MARRMPELVQRRESEEQNLSLAWLGKPFPSLQTYYGKADLRNSQTIHFLKTIKDPRFEDYNIRYRYGNRFAFLGNGEVHAHVKKSVQGLAPYIRNSDHEWSVA